ncbi:MAG: hypothetical protein IPL10_14750 [Bacteroidetes bacterium]|nr:hypothetical protein [Bacteroidota bacterium]
MTILVSCNDRQIVPSHTDTFYAIDRKTADTVKFYGFKNLDSAIYHAKKDKQNILVVFGGHTIEKNWESLKYYNDPNFINSNFKIVWLPVDSKVKAKDTTLTVFWYGKTRTLTTIGDQNKYFQEIVFNQSTQPLYCFIDTIKKPVGQVIGYEHDIKKITDFINSGLTK